MIHHAFNDSNRPASKAPPAGLAMNNTGNISCAFRDGSVCVTSPSSTLAAYPEVVPKFISTSLTPTESSASFRMANFLRYWNYFYSSKQKQKNPLHCLICYLLCMSRSRRDTATSSSGNSDLSSPLAIARTFSFDDNIETIGYCFKGGLISESFFLWLKSPLTKKVPNHIMYVF